MNAVRTVVIDDEKPARERLRLLLAQDPRVDLVAVVGSGREGIHTLYERAAANHPVQVVFLDVQMPEIDGFEVAKKIAALGDANELPAIVFVTAFDEYAIRAFDAHAIDYLLKPFSDERFAAALDRAIRHVAAGRAHALMAEMQGLLSMGRGGRGGVTRAGPSTSGLDRIVLKSGGRVRLLPVDQITWIEADEMYVKLHTRDGVTHLQRGPIGTLEASLDARQFVRIHRSAIVNIEWVTELRQDAHGDYVAVLRDKTEIRVGRTLRLRLQERLGLRP